MLNGLTRNRRRGDLRSKQDLMAETLLPISVSDRPHRGEVHDNLGMVEGFVTFSTPRHCLCMAFSF